MSSRLERMVAVTEVGSAHQKFAAHSGQDLRWGSVQAKMGCTAPACGLSLGRASRWESWVASSGRRSEGRQVVACAPGCATLQPGSEAQSNSWYKIRAEGG